MQTYQYNCMQDEGEIEHWISSVGNPRKVPSLVSDGDMSHTMGQSGSFANTIGEWKRKREEEREKERPLQC